ncbi:MAG TPA: ornithine carbamoyltransferase [Solirubrobacteraceae bacterium]|nr:ornithine carbamoyltransferase [Solirubrobacteraceae bacterium]
MTTLIHTYPRDLLRIADLGPAELQTLLDRAAAMKADRNGWLGVLRGGSVACYFAKPSTRTRVSVEAAVHRLGGLPIMLRPDELQLGRGEPIADTARVLSSYCAAIVIRTFAQDDVAEMAGAASVPVVNALTDDHHPCQALADLLTLHQRFGRLEGLRVAYIGDGNNVAHSLIESAPLAGFELALACPQGYLPDPEILRAAGPAVHLFEDPRDAVIGAHAVYTDVWVSMGDERERAERMSVLAPFRVDSRLMALASRDAIFLHCLPAHRGEEVAADVIDGPSSAVWEQAANRLPTEQAVLHALVTGWEG